MGYIKEGAELSKSLSFYEPVSLFFSQILSVSDLALFLGSK